MDELKKKIADLWAKVRRVRDAAKAEKRDLTSEEITASNADMDEIERLKVLLDAEERAAKLEGELSKVSANRSEPPKETRIEVGQDNRARKPWESFGHFLQAVAGAARAPHRADSRLFEIRAASGLQESVPAEGGFLVQTDYAQELLQRVYQVGVILPRCRRIPISNVSNAIKIPAIDETSRATGSRFGGVQVYWVAEGTAPTAKKPKFRQIELNLKKLAGLAYVTDELLLDATALEAVVRDSFSQEMAFEIDRSIVRGDGAGKPLGILSSPCLVTQAKETGQEAATFLWENAVNMWARMWAPSRASAVWLIEQSVEPQLYSMSLKVGTGGVPVFMPATGAAGQPYSTLFTRPIIPVEYCSALGTVGDVILADFSQYVVGEKGALEAASSMHVLFTTDEMTYRFIQRLDGQASWNSALTPYSAGNTLSPFVTLAVRA